MAWTAAVAALAVAALVIVTGGWLVRRAGWPERLLCVPAAGLRLDLNLATIAVGVGLLAVAVAVHLIVARRPPAESLDRSPPGTRGTADRS